MLSLKKLALVLVGSLALSLPLGGSAMGAGTIGWWSSLYEQGERHKALFHLIDCADSYKAPRDDFVLLPIVSDGLGREKEVADLAVQVFIYYNHLYGARGEKGYDEVLSRVRKRGAKVDLARYKNWMLVTAKNGARLRERPNKSGKVLTALKFGMQALAKGKTGHWVKVKPVGPGSVDPRFDRFQGYVHDSLLIPY